MRRARSKSAKKVKSKGEVYLLRLYVADNEPNSQIARENLSGICDQYLKDRCTIYEVDILKEYAVALKEKVFVTPTLVLLSPEPRASIVGNLNDRAKVVAALRLKNEHGT